MELILKPIPETNTGPIFLRMPQTYGIYHRTRQGDELKCTFECELLPMLDIMGPEIKCLRLALAAYEQMIGRKYSPASGN